MLMNSRKRKCENVNDDGPLQCRVSTAPSGHENSRLMLLCDALAASSALSMLSTCANPLVLLCEVACIARALEESSRIVSPTPKLNEGKLSFQYLYLCKLFRQSPPVAHLLLPARPSLPTTRVWTDAIVRPTRNVKWNEVPTYDWTPGLADDIPCPQRRRHFIESSAQFVIFDILERLPEMSDVDRSVFTRVPLLMSLFTFWWPIRMMCIRQTLLQRQHSLDIPSVRLAGRKEKKAMATRKNDPVKRALLEIEKRGPAIWEGRLGQKFALALRKSSCLQVLKYLARDRLYTGSEAEKTCISRHLLHVFRALFPRKY